MRNTRKGFTLIELLIVVVIVGILALAAIPLITSNTRDARRAEGTQLLGAARDYCRVEYSKNGTAPATMAGAGAGAFVGEYYGIASTVVPGAATVNTPGGTVVATAVTASDGNGTIDFAWGSGASDITFS